MYNLKPQPIRSKSISTRSELCYSKLFSVNIIHGISIPLQWFVSMTNTLNILFIFSWHATSSKSKISSVELVFLLSGEEKEED